MAASSTDLDAIVVGAGFSGLYALHKLKNALGLQSRILEKADGIGGTWYANRYPGALSDSESYLYCYASDRDHIPDSYLAWRYVRQPQVLAYLADFAARHDLLGHIELNTTVVAAHFEEESATWRVVNHLGENLSCKYLILGTGALSASIGPELDNIDSFTGEILYTSNWPADYSLAGKRVAVMGTGSTGSQLITACADDVESLVVLQRTSQYLVPLGNRQRSAEEVRSIKGGYAEIWKELHESPLAFGFEMSEIPAMSVSAAERERIFERVWNYGGPYNFMFGTFSDITTDPEANEAAAAFIRRKIAATVKDPATAEKLTPAELWARRPVAGSGYYEVFNQENVILEDVRTNPIESVEPHGLRMSNGHLHELDVIVFATGFDAFEGSYVRIDIHGIDDRILKEYWADVPRGYLGMSVSGFPNMFTVYGPNSSFSNNPTVIETQVDWIKDAIRYAQANGISTMDVSPSAENDWYATCDELIQETLFPKVKSWIFGYNVKGKSSATRTYVGGLKKFRRILDEESGAGYPSYAKE